MDVVKKTILWKMMNLIKKMLFAASIALSLSGCLIESLDDESDYCDTHECLPSTEIRHRPTSFAIELRADDSSQVAKLYTVDCKYLPGEDSSKFSTFCVDSVKYGDSDELHYLPQKSKHEEDSGDLEVAVNGTLRPQFADIPMDDDGHLRFTLVDHNNEEKPFDLDLSDYIGIYELHGDTFDFVFPPFTKFTAYSYDSTFDISQLPKAFTTTKEDDCFYYSVSLNDKGHEDRFTLSRSCYKMELSDANGSLSLSNLYSLPRMKESVRDSLPQADREEMRHLRTIRYPWHTETRLDKQGPDGEDDFTIFVIYGGYR